MSTTSHINTTPCHSHHLRSLETPLHCLAHPRKQLTDRHAPLRPHTYTHACPRASSCAPSHRPRATARLRPRAAQSRVQRPPARLRRTNRAAGKPRVCVYKPYEGRAPGPAARGGKCGHMYTQMSGKCVIHVCTWRARETGQTCVCILPIYGAFT